MASAASLVVGGHVELHGLVKLPELNGVVGTLVLYDEANGRWQVRIKKAAHPQTVCVRPVNLKNVLRDLKETLGEHAQRTSAAVSSSLESDCPICHEAFTSEAKVHNFGCGHHVHNDCWNAHSSVHFAEFISSGGSAGQSGARCPMCNAWDGPSAAWEGPWYERTPNELVIMCLGYVYQSRWQAAGEDRSMEDEEAFITDRIRLAKAAKQYESSMTGMTDTLGKIRKLVGVGGLQLLQADPTPHRKALVTCLIPFIAVARTAGTSAQAADDNAYIPHLVSWMNTL